MKKYVVIRIGCLECGLSSEAKGVFDTEKEADEFADKANDEYPHSDYSAEVFEIEV